MKSALKLLQLAGRIAGLPIPHLSELLETLPIPQQVVNIVKESKDEVNDICKIMSGLVGTKDGEALFNVDPGASAQLVMKSVKD